jgi:hypothetical protein
MLPLVYTFGVLEYFRPVLMLIGVVGILYGYINVMA